MSTDTRRCVSCGTVKPLGFFGRTPWGIDSTCLACRKTPPTHTAPKYAYDVAWRMCKKKRGYKTRTDAASAAASSMRHAEYLRIYQCPVCTRWHLTHRAEGQAS